MSEPSVKNKEVLVSLGVDHLQWLEEFGKGTNYTMSEVIRACLNHIMNEFGAFDDSKSTLDVKDRKVWIHVALNEGEMRE